MQGNPLQVVPCFQGILWHVLCLESLKEFCAPWFGFYNYRKTAGGIAAFIDDRYVQYVLEYFSSKHVVVKARRRIRRQPREFIEGLSEHLTLDFHVLEPEHSFPLDDPFYPFKVFGVLEVFNEALSIFVPFSNIYHVASGFPSPWPFVITEDSLPFPITASLLYQLQLRGCVRLSIDVRLSHWCAW